MAESTTPVALNSGAWGDEHEFNPETPVLVEDEAPTTFRALQAIADAAGFPGPRVLCHPEDWDDQCYCQECLHCG